MGRRWDKRGSISEEGSRISDKFVDAENEQRGYLVKWKEANS